MTTKVCNSCGMEKPVEEFYNKRHSSNGKYYRAGSCKPCSIAYNRRYNADKEKQRKYHLKYKYGLTPEEADALGDECEICGSKEMLNIDHNHTTGEVRGLLCWNCNTALGKFKDDANLLLNALVYLQGV